MTESSLREAVAIRIGVKLWGADQFGENLKDPNDVHARMAHDAADAAIAEVLRWQADEPGQAPIDASVATKINQRPGGLGQVGIDLNTLDTTTKFHQPPANAGTGYLE